MGTSWDIKVPWTSKSRMTAMKYRFKENSKFQNPNNKQIPNPKQQTNSKFKFQI